MSRYDVTKASTANPVFLCSRVHPFISLHVWLKMQPHAIRWWRHPLKLHTFLSSKAFDCCSFNNPPLDGISWFTLTTGSEYCNTDGIKKMTSWFSLVGKSMCTCVRYTCLSVSKQACTAECNISLMATCCVYDSTCMKGLWIFLQRKLITSNLFSRS